MRTDFKLKLICSKCGELLEVDSDKSKINYNSAYNAEVAMMIKPCAYCIKKAEEPLKMIKNALSLIENT